MAWKRSLQFLVLTAAYSFVISLVYLTLMYKPAVLTQSLSSGPQRQKLQSRRSHRSHTPVLNYVTTSRPPTVKPMVRRDKHEGYIDILTGEPLRLFCSSCAVVSSSGHLLNTTSGPEIDAAECVFRMNNAPVRGFESDVGTRTTVRSIAHVNLARSFERTDEARKELLQDMGTRSEYLLINWMNRVNVRRLQDREYRYAVLLAHLYPGVRFYAFNSDQMRYAESVFRDETGLTRQQANTWLSTGWFTLLAAMDICNKITVYGMADEDYCSNRSNESTSIPYHYYEPKGMKECAYYNASETRLDGGHLFITEKAVFRRWASKHRLTFKYPSWSVDPNSDEPLDSPFLRRYRQLMNETNYTIRSVRDYVRLEREARRRVAAEERTIELKHGNETFIIEKKQLMQKVMELVPEAKPIFRKTEVKEDRNGPVKWRQHRGKPREPRGANSRGAKHANRRQRPKQRTKRKIRSLVHKKSPRVKR